MPADLFNPASRPSPAGTSRRLTLFTSIALHVAAVVIFLLGPLAGAVALPPLMTRIDSYVMAEVLPPPPPAPVQPATVTPVPAANPSAAPIEAPSSIEPEVEVPVPAGPVRAGGLPVSGAVGVPGGLAIAGEVALSAPAARVAPAPVRPGGNIDPPRRIVYEPPAYPPIAQAARVEGTVILEAIISETGDVTSLRILRSVPLLDEAARTAVSRWRYSPTTLNGVRVPVIMTVTVTFTFK